jgi:hypothetical protein
MRPGKIALKKGRKQNIERLPHGISYNGSPHQF